MAMVIIAREFAVTATRMAATQQGIVIAANWWGKAKTIVQVVVIFLLIAVMYIGRGDYGNRPDLGQCVRDMRKSSGSRGKKDALEHMAGKNPLGEYLREGMDRLCKMGLRPEQWLKA